MNKQGLIIIDSITASESRGQYMDSHERIYINNQRFTNKIHSSVFVLCINGCNKEVNRGKNDGTLAQIGAAGSNENKIGCFRIRVLQQQSDVEMGVIMNKV